MVMHLPASRKIRHRWTQASGAVAIALTLALTACNSPDQSAATAPVDGDSASGNSAVTSDPAPKTGSAETSQATGEPATTERAASDQALSPGRHCYAVESAVLTATVGITVTEDGMATGEGQSDPANDGTMPDFGPTYQSFSGSIQEDALNLDLTKYIQEDRFTEAATWQLANDQLSTNEAVYDQVDCSVVEAQLADAKQFISVMSSPYELEAERSAGVELTDASATPNALTEYARSVRVRRLSFAPGSSGGVVEDAVIRAQRDEYLVGAAAGQTMRVGVYSEEQNAVLGVAAPDGSVLVNEETDAELDLSQSGDYSIVVSGTRGNASYQLQVEIR